jgi:hypothetical protein
MLVLVVVNLNFIVFDWSFGIRSFREVIEWISPTFFVWYRDVIHPDFYAYDLFFVIIFITELLIRWTLSVRRKEYYRWWFYPIIHWYDVLGCLPLSTFRFLRLFRIFSLLYRLQRMGAVDWSETYAYVKYMEYKEIVVEEISDRVVVNVLRGFQEELQEGGPIADRLIDEVIEPRKDVLVQFISHRLAESTDYLYTSNKTKLSFYIQSVVSDAVNSSEEIKRLRKVPVIGDQVVQGLQNGIADSLIGGIDRLATDLSKAEINRAVEAGANSALVSLRTKHPDDEVEDLFKDMVRDAIDIIIEQVEVKKWQIRAEEAKQNKNDISNGE